MDSSEDEALFMLQSSTNTDILAKIEGKRLYHLVISACGLIFYVSLKAAFPFSL